MKNNILLISESYIKENSALNDAVFGKYLLPAIRESQDMGLQKVIGTCLYELLLNLVESGDILKEEYAIYKDLLDNYVLTYLLYQVQYTLIPLLNLKLGNLGSVVANDEHIQTLSQSNIELAMNHFKERADFYAKRCQDFIRNNKKNITLCDCSCFNIKGGDSLTTSIFLG